MSTPPKYRYLILLEGGEHHGTNEQQTAEEVAHYTEVIDTVDGGYLSWFDDAGALLATPRRCPIKEVKPSEGEF